MSPRLCEFCAFFVKTHYAMGDCRHRSPVFFNDPPEHPRGDVEQRRWPRVSAYESCGDYKGK